MNMLNEKMQSVKESVNLKLFIIAVLTALLLIPQSMLQSLIFERQQRRNETIDEVYQKWGRAQTFTGPYVTVPYEYVVEENGKEKKLISFIHILPDDLKISAQLIPEIRYRGIFNVVTYQAELDLDATFAEKMLPADITSKYEVQWNNATLDIGLSDLRGIRNVSGTISGNALNFSPGLPDADLAASGISNPVAFDGSGQSVLHLEMIMNGSETLSVVPLGKETSVSMNSLWNSPGFQGNFLPDSRKISEDGFTASWNILELNRNYPQYWIGKNYEVQSSAFGVGLVMPVDHYQKSMRSVKYAILFILLTFLVFFFAETFSHQKIHPVQYLLSGLAIIVFFSLLIALSEHMNFNLAYLVSGILVTALMSLFTWQIFRKRSVLLAVTSLMVILYSFLFTVLQLSDYSLLLGNIGLFLVLAVVMIVSTRIKWYKTTSGQ